MNFCTTRALLAAGAFAIAALPALPGAATGTALIQKSDGTIKSYANVHIAVRDEALAITSSDGQGTLVFGKAACTKIGALVRCLPYDATLLQYGGKVHIALRSGTVWLNPTQSSQPLTHSSAKLPPRGVLLLVTTKAGTIVSLTGRVDEVVK